MKDWGFSLAKLTCSFGGTRCWHGGGLWHLLSLGIPASALCMVVLSLSKKALGCAWINDMDVSCSW